MSSKSRFVFQRGCEKYDYDSKYIYSLSSENLFIKLEYCCRSSGSCWRSAAGAHRRGLQVCRHVLLRGAGSILCFLFISWDADPIEIVLITYCNSFLSWLFLNLWYCFCFLSIMKNVKQNYFREFKRKVSVTKLSLKILLMNFFVFMLELCWKWHILKFTLI